MQKFIKRPEYVEWHDHWAAKSGWRGQDTLDNKPCLCYTVGFPVKEDKEGVFFASSMCDDELNGGIYILKSCIVKRKKL